MPCRYHVWDDGGRELYKSDSYTVALTAAAWRPIGDCFAIGLHNTILLCDAVGWVASSQAHASGSALALTWSPDGMSCAAPCVGNVLVGDILDLSREFGNIQVRLSSGHVQGSQRSDPHSLCRGMRYWFALEPVQGATTGALNLYTGFHFFGCSKVPPRQYFLTLSVPAGETTGRQGCGSSRFVDRSF
jgi:hypothetical protein